LNVVEQPNDNEGASCTISLFRLQLDVKLFSAKLYIEGEVKGKLTPCVVAAREWRVNSLADLKHNPGTCEQHRPATAIVELLQKEISSKN
jgi:hypothetical protein